MTVENKIKEVFKKTWNIFSNRFVVLILGTLIACLLMVFIITIPPLIYGLHYMCFNLIRKRKAKISDIFKGFSYFFRSWGIALLGLIGVIIGLILLIVPGILLMIAWQFAFAISVIENKGVIDSLDKSYKIAKNNFSFSAVFWILMMVLGTIGSITRIGILLTLPFTILATCIAAQLLAKKKK